MFVCVSATFLAYGAWTVGRREAVVTAYGSEGAGGALLRAAPALVVLWAALVVGLSVLPVWGALALAVGWCGVVSVPWRSSHVRKPLRRRRPSRAVLVANFVSRRRGAGADLLAHLCRQADAEGRALWLEAANRPGLVAYYERQGFQVVGEPVSDHARQFVYMERQPHMSRSPASPS